MHVYEASPLSKVVRTPRMDTYRHGTGHLFKAVAPIVDSKARLMFQRKRMAPFGLSAMPRCPHHDPGIFDSDAGVDWGGLDAGRPDGAPQYTGYQRNTWIGIRRRSEIYYWTVCFGCILNGIYFSTLLVGWGFDGEKCMRFRIVKYARFRR
jgi:hypothetical protein